MNHQVMSSDLQCPSLNIQWWYHVAHLKVHLDASHLAILDPSSLELLWLRFNSPPVGARTASHHFQLVFSRHFHPTLAPWLLDPFLMYYTIIYQILYVRLSIISPRSKSWFLKLGPRAASKTLSGWASVLSTNSWKPSGTERFHSNKRWQVGISATKKKIQKDLSKRSMDLCRCVRNIDWNLIIL